MSHGKPGGDNITPHLRLDVECPKEEIVPYLTYLRFYQKRDIYIYTFSNNVYIILANQTYIKFYK